MTEEELEQLLRETLECDGGELGEKLSGSSTFEEGGVLTTNRGLTLRFEDGSEFQLTLVRSR